MKTTLRNEGSTIIKKRKKNSHCIVFKSIYINIYEIHKKIILSKIHGKHRHINDEFIQVISLISNEVFRVSLKLKSILYSY